MNSLTASEKHHLRELTKRQQDYAALPVMDERTKLWYDHNMLKPTRPLIVMEELSFEQELLPPLKCQSAFGQELEKTILRHLMNHELVDDDKVIPPFHLLKKLIGFKEFNYDFRRVVPKGSKNALAYHIEAIIEDLESDFHRLSHSTYWEETEKNRERLDAAQDAIGDILPIAVKNQSLEWHLIPTLKAVNLMGLENLMCEMALNPDLVHQLMAFIVEDMNAYLDWQEEHHLLTMNNGNDYAGSGSMGFTTELTPQADGHVTTKSLWGNLNSQESSEISSEMFGELIFPYYQKLAQRFGLVYYGCCEPVHSFWGHLQKLPNLRKISISAWCNEELMGEALKNSGVIYSRKPNPNFIGVGKNLDEEAFQKHIQKTLNAAKDCSLEFIFRDIYTLSGDLNKPARAVQLLRQMF